MERMAAWLWLLLPAMAAAQPLEVGFGKADITPELGPRPVYLAGFGQGRQANEIHDRLAVRAVVFKHGDRKIAMACADVVGLFLPLVQSIRGQLPGFDYVLVSAAHNHHGPDTMGLWGPNPLRSGVDAVYMKLLEDRIVQAIRAADAARRPVEAVIAIAQVPELLHDSRPPIVKHDTLVVLQFREPATAKVCGILVQWNCHPETIDSKSRRLSPDYVGATCAHLEKHFHCPVGYFSGTVGGLMTSMHVPVKDKAGQLLAEGSVAKTERYGELLGERAIAALSSSQPINLTPFDVKSRSLLLPVDNKMYHLAKQLGVFDRAMEAWNGDPNAAPGPALEKIQGRPAVRTEVGRVQLGQLSVAVIPGEIYPELVLGKVQDPSDSGADFPEAPAEAAIYEQMPGPFKMIVGLGNDELGYILPKRQWDEKPPYTYGLKKAPYGEVNSLGPDTAPILCDAFRDLWRRPRP